MRFFQKAIALLLLITLPVTHLPAIEHVTFEHEVGPALSYDEIIALIDAIESDRPPPLEEIDTINHLLVELAREGVLPGESTHTLESDIAALLAPEPQFELWDREVAFASSVELELCKGWLEKNWEKTKEFVKDHKKEIIIGAAIVVAVTTVVVIIAATSACAGVAAGAAVGAATALPEKTIQESIDSFKELASEDTVLESLDYHEDRSTLETVKELGSFLAHEAFDGIAEIAGMIPRLGEELKGVATHILPEGMLPPEMDVQHETSYEELAYRGHLAIDRAFATDQAPLYTLEVKEAQEKFIKTILPPPGGMPRCVDASKFREIVVAGREAAALADELGFSAKEIAKLENRGGVERHIHALSEKILGTSREINFSEHALKRAVERKVSREAIVNALDKPLKIEEIKIDHLGRPSQRIVGEQAEVVLNPETKQVVSVNPTSRKKAEKLINGVSDGRN